MSTAKFNQWLNPDGTENYKCRAWVNFNGTGTVTIRAAGNVSSITDNGTGDYTVNFTAALVDTNYSPVFGGIPGGPGNNQITIGVRSVAGVAGPPDLKTTSQLRISSSTTSATLAVIDNSEIDVAIFR